jgi:hypothetical protein
MAAWTAAGISARLRGLAARARSGRGARAPESGASAPLSARIQRWLPVAIVAVSVLAAVMGWRASLADETSTHADELARQDLLHQQELILDKIQGVDADVRLFGSFEQYSLLGQALLRDARTVGGSEGQSLARQGQGDIELARGIGSQFRFNGAYNPSDESNYYSRDNTTGSLQPDGSYRPHNPYTVGGPGGALAAAESGDEGLTSLEPARLRAHGRSERLKGVDLIGVAALFIAALVFFTLAAVSRGRRTVGFAGSGLAVTVVALILFPIVELT